MRQFRRNVAAILLLTAFVVPGICEVTSIIFGEFEEQPETIFLGELVSYLNTVSDFSGSQLEIEFSGRLPSMSPGRRIDFYLVNTEENHFVVLYRSRSEASYKRAAVIVRQVVRKADIGRELPLIQELQYAEPYRIEDGKLISILISLGSIRLSIGGKAMQSGSAGDTIRVRVLETGREFAGTITGPLEVRIDL